MGSGPLQDFSFLLGRSRAGDERARDELIVLIHDELRWSDSRLMRRERADHTFSPTDVVHETVIRMPGDAVFDRAVDWSLLFASAARAMREVLIDHARRRACDLRGGGRHRVSIETMSCFGRLTISEIAETLGVAPATEERDWRLERAWLRGQFRRDDR
jgi:ECF sigma factor